MKKSRVLSVVMTEEAWELFDSYAGFIRKRYRTNGRPAGTLIGAIVEFFLLAMRDNILEGKEEVDLDVFRRKFKKIQRVVKRRKHPIPLELLAEGTKDRRPPSPIPDANGAGGAPVLESRKLTIPWPV